MAALTLKEQEIVIAIFDKLDNGYPMIDVFQEAKTQLNETVDIVEIFDSWAGVYALADWE